MNHDLRTTLEQVRVGELSVEEATRRLSPSADLGFANVDLGRQERCGFSEVIYCAGKTPEQVVAIAAEILVRSPRILLTRADQTQADAVAAAIPDAVFHNRARCITVDPEPLPREGLVAIIAAGTSDLPVAEEASVTAQIMGCDVTTHWDVGVAGLHRLVERIEAVREARVIVASAGMEGALASVVGRLVDQRDLHAQVGCGLHLDGIVPLLAMLNSCAAGVAVVNVDNGFGAGYFAALINRTNAPNPPIS